MEQDLIDMEDLINDELDDLTELIEIGEEEFFENLHQFSSSVLSIRVRIGDETNSGERLKLIMPKKEVIERNGYPTAYEIYNSKYTFTVSDVNNDIVNEYWLEAYASGDIDLATYYEWNDDIDIYDVLGISHQATHIKSQKVVRMQRKVYYLITATRP